MELIEYKIHFAKAPQPFITQRAGTQTYIQFGEFNTYPSFLNDLYQESPKHGAIIKSKTTYIYGSGFTNLPEQKANDYETWNEVLKKCILDDEKFGGYYLQIIWGRDGRIASVNHIKYHKVRTNENNSKFWVKDEWDALKQISAKDRRKERDYPAFDINDPQGAQILFVKQHGDQNDVYPLPRYIQAINYIDADRLISQHILGMAKDGFVASKLINLNNSEPSAEQKKQLENLFAKRFTGADGKRFILSFNKNADSQVQIQDLGNTQLTKEDFTNINNLIMQEIYAAHQITSPVLFGIKTEGQLGARSEMRDAYEIFKNTYVNERQQAHEDIFNNLMNLAGLGMGRKIVPVEPIGIDITADMITALNLPKKYFLDKLGINAEDYPELQTAAQPVPVQNNGNDYLRNLTGRQLQNIQRIVRDYSRNKITRKMASTMLKEGYLFTDEHVVDFLGEDETVHQNFMDESLIMHFAEFGDSRDRYVVVKSFDFERNKDIFPQQFEEQVKIGKLEANIMNLIGKDKRITPEVLSTVTKQPVEIINKILDELEKNGYINNRDGVRSLVKPVSEVTDVKPSTTQILVRYSYEGPEDSRNRPFCAKMMELNRFYSRSDIETISERVGYSVWDRRGGWWTQPDGSHSPSCRHYWKTNIVLKKV